MMADVAPNHQTFQSLTARMKPFACSGYSALPSSLIPLSSSCLFSTRRRSKGEIHFDVSGKSGMTRRPINAKKIVVDPSM